MREYREIAIAGTGGMARGIAELLTGRGMRTHLIGRSPEASSAALAAVKASRALAVRRRTLTGEEASAADALLLAAADPGTAAGADLWIETVVENLAAKRETISRLLPHLAPDAGVATNTSALRVADVMADLPGPERAFGLHFMNPAPTVNLIELVWTDRTGEPAKQAARALCRQLGRETVEVADQPGFLVNRLLMLLLNEAARLAEEGAAPGDIDKAMRLACGHPMGPAALADFIGLDTVCAELRVLATGYGERYAPAPLLERLVAEGRLGRKTGGGLLGIARAAKRTAGS